MSFLFGDSEEDQKGDEPWGCFGGSDFDSSKQDSQTTADSFFIINSENTPPSVQRQKLSKSGPTNTGVCIESQGKTSVSSADVSHTAPIPSTKEYCAPSPSCPTTNNPAPSPPFLPPQSPSQFAVPCSVPTPTKKPRLCSMEEESGNGTRPLNGGQFKERNGNEIEMKKEENIPSWKSDGMSRRTGVSGMMWKLFEEQQEKLGNIVGKIEQGEKEEEQIVASMEQILRDAQEYKQRLSGIKKTYSDRLSQVSSFLNLESKK